MAERILVTGANGQLGRALRNILCSPPAGGGPINTPHEISAASGEAWKIQLPIKGGVVTSFLSRAEMDLADAASIHAALAAFQPTIIINAAAYTAVDQAESEPELAQHVNATASGIMAEYAARHDTLMVQISTDYVYDGAGGLPRDEATLPAPLNVYGRTKLQGEQAVQNAGCRYLIFRTSWLYDAEGKNFFTTMRRLMMEREEIRVVADQFGAPTYVPQLAAAIMQAVQNACAATEFPSGIYHLAHAGQTSWHDFATAILQGLQARGVPVMTQRVVPIISAQYPTPAARPKNSRLDCGRAASILRVQLPDWRIGLEAAFSSSPF